jgi:hypothetical protein
MIANLNNSQPESLNTVTCIHDTMITVEHLDSRAKFNDLPGAGSHGHTRIQVQVNLSSYRTSIMINFPAPTGRAT